MNEHHHLSYEHWLVFVQSSLYAWIQTVDESGFSIMQHFNGRQLKVDERDHIDPN
jgi:hypothetical protein